MNHVLSQEKAEQLLHELKKSLIQSLYAPNNRENVDFDVKGIDSGDLYTINVYRGRINRDKISYSARIKVNNIILLELHINPSTKHFDPITETVIYGSHWHIYKEGYDHRCAFPATDIFDADFVKNTMTFLERFHVIEKPSVYEQQSLI